MANGPANFKRRTREHVIADLGVNFVERQILLAGFVAERQYFDYGVDLVVKTFNVFGEIEPGPLHFQVKSTESIGRRARRNISFSLDSRDLRNWMLEKQPVILTLYDATSDRAYWVHVQVYFASVWSEIGGSIGAFRAIRIPLANRLNESVVMKLAASKNMMYQTT